MNLIWPINTYSMQIPFLVKLLPWNDIRNSKNDLFTDRMRNKPPLDYKSEKLCRMNHKCKCRYIGNDNNPPTSNNRSPRKRKSSKYWLISHWLILKVCIHRIFVMTVQLATMGRFRYYSTQSLVHFLISLEEKKFTYSCHSKIISWRSTVLCPKRIQLHLSWSLQRKFSPNSSDELVRMAMVKSKSQITSPVRSPGRSSPLLRSQRCHIIFHISWTTIWLSRRPRLFTKMLKQSLSHSWFCAARNNGLI